MDQPQAGADPQIASWKKSGATTLWEIPTLLKSYIRYLRLKLEAEGEKRLIQTVQRGGLRPQRLVTQCAVKYSNVVSTPPPLYFEKDIPKPG